MTFGIVSLGCAKNRTDSEAMIGLMTEAGYEIVTDPAEAEILIVNTCGFIESAKEESINTILEMAEYKAGKAKVLIAAGCLAERYAKDIKTELPEVDAIVGTGDFPKIVSVVQEALEGGFVCYFGHQNDALPEGLPRVLSTPPYTAYLKIADGCDNNCTYCAIPQIRGHFKSRSIEAIMSEAQSLVQSGVKEIIIIAQDTTRYGIDLYGEPKLDVLLDGLAKIPELHWIRVHYFYTEAIYDKLLEVMAKYDNICNYIDMPIQHINDKILRRMARRVKGSEIKAAAQKIRTLMPDACIRTSIIVGFPGESEEDFAELYEAVKEIKFNRMGVFTYSPEENTPAASFDGAVDEDTKNSRRDRLMTLQQGISKQLNEQTVGKTLEVLVEGYDENEFMYFGRSYADSIEIDGKVYFAADDEVEVGTFVNVQILDASEYDLVGKCI